MGYIFACVCEVQLRLCVDLSYFQVQSFYCVKRKAKSTIEQQKDKGHEKRD